MPPVYLWSYLEQSHEMSLYLDFMAQICLPVQKSGALLLKIHVMHKKRPGLLHCSLVPFYICWKSELFTLHMRHLK